MAMIEISTDKTRVDVDRVHDYLCNQSYWAKGVPRDVVERSIENALVFGAYDGGELVGFARVVTDYAVFAYVGDVFVVPAYRGRGISKQIMAAIRSHPRLQNLRRWSLVTSDAHGLYRQFGFRELASPEKHMEDARAKPYGLHEREIGTYPRPCSGATCLCISTVRPASGGKGNL
jgi:GNAT superfamily N-acetyltransferase